MKALLLALALVTPAGAQQRTEVVNPPGEQLEVTGTFTTATSTTVATEKTLVAISTTATAIKARVDLLLSEVTGASMASDVASIKTRANLLATEATLVALSTTAAAIKARADLLATEATLATRASESTSVAISTNVTALLTRANLLATEATAATRASEATQVALSTTATALLVRANLLATEATAVASSTNVAQVNANTVGISSTTSAILSRLNSGTTVYQGGPWGMSQVGSYVVTPGSNAPTAATQTAISTTATQIAANTAATSTNTVANGLTLVAISTTLTSLNGKVTTVNTNDVRTASGTASVTAFPPSVVSYIASSSGPITGPTAANAVASIAYLFHPSTDTKRYEIDRILVSVGCTGNGGVASFRGAFITTENATPGGTQIVPTPNDRADAATSGRFFSGATGAPTRLATGELAQLANCTRFDGSSQSNIEIFSSAVTGKPIVLRGGVAEGFEVRFVVKSAIASAPEMTATFFWRQF